MYRFTLFPFFILILFCVDYNLAENRDQKIQRLTKQVKDWPEKQDHVFAAVGLKQKSSPTQTFSINVVEKINVGGRDNQSHFRFDLVQDGNQSRSFYDFQIDAFAYYFENQLRFILREDKGTETLSLDFASVVDARYFYSKTATFGDANPGELVDKTVDSSGIVVETYKRGTTERKTTSKDYKSGVTIRSKIINGTTIFDLSTRANDEPNSKVPILIFASQQFNIGCQTMGRQVMLYLIDHADTIFVVNFPSPAAATTFYDTIKRERVENDDEMLSVEEMIYDRSEIATLRMAK